MPGCVLDAPFLIKDAWVDLVSGYTYDFPEVTALHSSPLAILQDYSHVESYSREHKDILHSASFGLMNGQLFDCYVYCNCYFLASQPVRQSDSQPSFSPTIASMQNVKEKKDSMEV